jgi:hypothetical protein
MYSWPGAERFGDRDIFDLAPDGAMSTGSFSSMLMSIFGGAARFTYLGDTSIQGKRGLQFAFRVSEKHSRYSYLYGNGEEVKLGYAGTALIDPEHSELVRLDIHTDRLPPDTNACEITRTMEYDRVKLNGADFLLPKEATISIIHSDGSVAQNVITYSACREFRGESTLIFESPVEALAAPRSNSRTPKLSLPAGLPFSLTFTERIDPATAAAGDVIGARLNTAIVDHGRTLVPVGAAVKARIVSVKRFYGPRNASEGARANQNRQNLSLSIAVKLEYVEIDGTRRRLFAGLDRRVRPVVKFRRSMRIDVAAMDNSFDSDAGVFEFRGGNPDRVVEAGLESSWVTKGLSTSELSRERVRE